MKDAEYDVTWSAEKIFQHKFQKRVGGWVSWEDEPLSPEKWTEYVQWHVWHEANGHGWRYDKENDDNGMELDWGTGHDAARWNDWGTGHDAARWKQTCELHTARTQYERTWAKWQLFWQKTPEEKPSDSDTARSSKDHYEVLV